MERARESLDSYDLVPLGMRSYLRHYGKHFSKAMYEFAVSKMRRGNNDKIAPMERKEYDALLSKNAITIDNDVMYDGMYVMSMAKSDFMGSSISDEHHLALFVKDYIDDPDQVDGFVFNRFYADCVLKGIPIEWDEML